MKRMKRFASRFCALLLVLTVSAAALAPAALAAKAQLPDLPSDQCVVDDAGILSSSTTTTIQNLNTQLTEQWINSKNVDVMWGDASAVDNGSRKALEAAGADTHFDIAQPIDILGDDQPTVIASTVTDWKIDQAMDEIEAGTFGGGKAITANMDNGGVTLGKFSDKVPSDVQDKINEYADQIKAGTYLSDSEIEAIQSTLG